MASGKVRGLNNKPSTPITGPSFLSPTFDKKMGRPINMADTQKIGNNETHKTKDKITFGSSLLNLAFSRHPRLSVFFNIKLDFIRNMRELTEKITTIRYGRVPSLKYHTQAGSRSLEKSSQLPPTTGHRMDIIIMVIGMRALTPTKIKIILNQHRSLITYLQISLTARVTFYYGSVSPVYFSRSQ